MLVWLPLRTNDVEVGVLAGAAPGALVVPRRRSDAAALVAAQSAASIDAALSLAHERRTAATDPLTGLLNRRGFGDVLESALGDAVATRRPLSFCVLDCDEFKAINDRGGHERGDRVLVEPRRADQRGTLRDDDRAARVGGDEFGLMLPDTGLRCCTGARGGAALGAGARPHGGRDDAACLDRRRHLPVRRRHRHPAHACG